MEEIGNNKVNGRERKGGIMILILVV